MANHTGGCHCGRVRFEVVAPAQLEVTDCNCSICSKSGYLHLIVPRSQFKLLSGADVLSTYEFNTGTAKHLFCAVCGIKSFYVPRSHPDGYSVNARCLDEGTVTGTKITSMDGLNWEKSHPQGKSQIPIASKPSRSAVAALLDASDLPSADLSDAHMEHFFFCGPAVAPTALVGVELCGSSALLRSLVVRPEHRSIGLGAALVDHAEAYARARGVRAIYLLTTTAEEFFQSRGYVTAARAGAPPEIAATREFAAICPASSAFMSKRL